MKIWKPFLKQLNMNNMNGKYAEISKFSPYFLDNNWVLHNTRVFYVYEIVEIENSIMLEKMASPRDSQTRRLEHSKQTTDWS